MSLPERLTGAVGDEDIVANVPLGGDDILAVTATRTLVYRADGLLSDETIDEYGHDVERVDVSTGRRKAKITLGYGLDGEETISLPTKRLDDALHPVLAGVLAGSGVTGPGESVLRTFRFSELTIIITSARVVKHIGSAVWDPEFEEFPFESLTGLDFEEGTVATSVVLTHDGRSERFKAPNEAARAVKETLVGAVCAFYDVDSLETFRAAVAEDDAETDNASGPTDFGNGPDPLSASPVADAAEANESEGAASGTTEAKDGGKSVSNEEFGVSGIGTVSADQSAEPMTDAASSEPMPNATPQSDESDRPIDTSTETATSNATETTPEDVITESADESSSDPAASEMAAAETAGTNATAADDAFEGSPFESAGVEEDDLSAEIAALRETISAQSERLDRQSALIEQLIEELRQGR